mmetsp:Transcript_90372/g.264413  ORF Transcript_90372/g.264413 Transcript_90372/m.264413 type:complete len:204 (-) Transcript_90372:566-1177(-)
MPRQGLSRGGWMPQTRSPHQLNGDWQVASHCQVSHQQSGELHARCACCVHTAVCSCRRGLCSGGVLQQPRPLQQFTRGHSRQRPHRRGLLRCRGHHRAHRRRLLWCRGRLQAHRRGLPTSHGRQQTCCRRSPWCHGRLQPRLRGFVRWHGRQLALCQRLPWLQGNLQASHHQPHRHLRVPSHWTAALAVPASNVAEHQPLPNA